MVLPMPIILADDASSTGTGGRMLKVNIYEKVYRRTGDWVFSD
jgi:hypothetical protein